MQEASQQASKTANPISTLSPLTPTPSATMTSVAKPNSRPSSTSRTLLTNSNVNENNINKKDAIPNKGKPGKSSSTRNSSGGGGGGRPKGASRTPKTTQQLASQKGGNQQGHNFKCPQPRSSFPAKGNKVNNQGVMTEDGSATEFEVGSVFKAGSKKHNLNHLLNFQFEPRGGNHEGSRRQKKGDKVNKVSTPRPTYKKEQYLQANCQFIVKDGSDLTVYLADPDLLVDWNLIEQVGLKTSCVPSCPICLYPPSAAKIARCGHVFCWPCILHYLALSDDPWRKCPICYDSIYKEDLKSVVSLLHSYFKTGDEIELHLMRRERNSLFALPVRHYHPDIEKNHPRVSQPMNSYSKLVKASALEVVNTIISRERTELENQFRNEKDEPEACFIEEALEHLAKREMALLSDAASSVVAIPATLNEVFQITERDENALIESSEGVIEGAMAAEALERPRHVSSSSDGASSVEVEEGLEENINDFVSAEDLDISSIQPAVANETNEDCRKQQRKDTFYFYQSSDGQAIFLHALNVQMLVHEYGSLDKCPPIIRGKILEKDNTSMTEELRNRLRYLRHLPVTCNFEVCEIQLRNSIISKDTVKKFQDQLDSRRRQRARRAREEKRREKRIMIEENKLMGKYPEAKLRIESSFHFPEISNASFTMSASSPSLRLSNESIPSASTISATDQADSGGVSFAKMLRKGATKLSTTGMKRSETMPVNSVFQRARRTSDSEPEPEGYIPPPPQASFGDALAHALEQATSGKNTNEESNAGKRNGKKGKKSKGTKILLTSASRPTI